MKVLKAKAELCDGCGRCELVCSQVWFKEEDRSKSAIKIEENSADYDINVCSQCGDCIEVCPTVAIYRNKAGVVLIDKEKCVGCFSCIGFCPTLSMRWHKDYLEPFKCIACGRCAKECPTGALNLENN
ncbi:MAG: 4Fe-4S dicluster domain-containing protein [Bacillota bacterium]